jgi:uncharacterized protein YndB with AHSA1/START domain
VSPDLAFERLLNARPEQVFDAFTSPAGQRGFPTAALRDEHRTGLPTAFARLERTLPRP